MTASKKFADENPEILKRIVKVNREALDWINAHPKEALEIGAKEHGISLKDAETLKNWSNYYNTLTDADIKGLEADQKFLKDNGMMEKTVNVKELVLPMAMQK